YLAVMAIEQAGRPALVVTPTIDLLSQWYDELITAFAVPVGLMGGGSYDIQPLTVTTYDSAYIHLERWGNRFGLVVFDECHHLPGPTYLAAAVGSLAPYRLGLTATPERADGQEALLPELIGPVVYRREIKQLAGDLLAAYRAERLLIFTYDNATVYLIARRLLVPAITHQTKAKERRKILDCFHSGEYPIVVTSQVLNEGVDVPAASVGIILSGTGSVREHVQRLGRLLRKHGEKQAILYEVVTRDTAEEITSDRRRQHHAYR